MVDYYNVFRNLKKAFASYGGGSIGNGENKDENSPAREIESLFVLLKDAITECELYCQTIGVDLNEIAKSKETFSKLSLFDKFADTILANDEQKKQFLKFQTESFFEQLQPPKLDYHVILFQIYSRSLWG